MSDHETRTCLVTGGSSGIGYAAAARLLDDGWAVTSLSRRAQGPDGAQTVAGDAADVNDIERALAVAAPRRSAPRARLLRGRAAQRSLG